MKRNTELRFVIRSENDLGGSTLGDPIRQLRAEDLPLGLADLHAQLAVDEAASIQIVGPSGGLAGSSLLTGADYSLSDVIEGAGFTLDRSRSHADGSILGLRRLFSLADSVGPGMRVLICGLNPSLYSAEIGVGFGRPGNRFWPAALAAKLVAEVGDPRAALLDHGLGMTDLAKRPTRKADELSRSEYKQGLARVERLVRWLQPGVVCFVGLAGWRAAVDRKASAGLQPDGLGGVPTYLMPSTSGLNASSRPADLAEHLHQVKLLTRAPADHGDR